MDINKKNLKKIINFLGVVLRCPICSASYSDAGGEVMKAESVIRAQGSRFLVHSDCSKCKGSVIFSVDITEIDVVSIGMITDLTYQDSLKFQDYNALDYDDCIEMHEMLRSGELDFRQMFA